MGLFDKPSRVPPQRRRWLPPSAAAVSSGVGSASFALSATAAAPFGVGAGALSVSATGGGAWLHAGTGSAALSLTSLAVSSNIFPLAISADDRHLVQADGTPFLICADSTWSLGVNMPTGSVASYLNTITGQGFNAVMMNAIEHHYSVVKPPKDVDGNLPFTLTMNGATYTGSPNGTPAASGTQTQFTADAYSNINNQAPDPTQINNTYWTRIETILSACLARNVAVFVWPMYLGFHGNQEGWISELVVWDAVIGAGGFTGQSFADPTKSKMWNYGAWLAARWAAYPNIIWVAGGDFGSNGQTMNAAQAAAVKGCIDGMKSQAPTALWTAHWDRPCISDDTAISGVTWDLNFAYGDDATAEVSRRAYAVTATKPAFFGEGYYEAGLFGGSAPYRRYLWWGMLGSIGGAFYGHEQLWRFDDGTPGTDWTTLLATTARLDAQRQFAFFATKPWHRLKPSGLGGMGTLITVGGGTASPQSTTYIAAACTALGDLLLAYMPPAHSGTMTVDMTKLGAAAVARWFDPTNATFTAAGTFPNTGTQAFTRPGNNSAGDGDWLLVLETSTGTASITTTATAVGAAIVAVDGTASIVITGQGVGQSQAQASGSASFALAATAVSGVVIQGVGSSTLSLAASAVGARTVTAAGAGSFAYAATAVATATATAVGQATLTLLATAEGSSTGTGPATGAAAFTTTATGVAAWLAAVTGTAAVTFTAAAISTVQEPAEVEPGTFAALVAEMDDLIIEHLG